MRPLPLVLHARLKRSERGAGLVEFALILPVFMCMVLGMFSGGIAYDTKQGITSGAREGSRYGATLPIEASPCSGASGATNLDQYLWCVTNVTINAASGDLNPSSSGTEICVAYINDTGTSNSTDDVTKYRRVVGTSSATSGSTDCYAGVYGMSADGMSGKRRVQVVVKRTKKLEALFFSTTLNLSSSSVTPYEPITS